MLALLSLALLAQTIPIALPHGERGIGFDDLVYAPGLERVLVPGGRTGELFLVDPKTREIAAVSGVARSKATFAGGHGEGTTSADEGRGLIFASDRGRRRLVVIDPRQRAVVASAALEAGPDYVRFSPATGDVWVTEPKAEQIEVFAIAREGAPVPRRVKAIKVPGGPESLVFDGPRGRAYTHLWQRATVAIDVTTLAAVGRWENGCAESRGIAIDERHGLLFAGCDEGKATVMDVAKGGAVVATAETGKGVDVIAFSPQLRHLYVPGDESATMTVLAVTLEGKLSQVAVVPTAKGAHCVAADDRGGAWVCDPTQGRLLLYQDKP